MVITKEEIGKGYDKIAEKIYVSDEFYNEVMAIEKNWQGAVLDAGCGQGPVLFALAKRNFQFSIFNFQKLKITRLVGIDISDKLLEMARKRVPEAEIIKADIDAMPFAENSFDFVVMVDVFQYLCQNHELHELSSPDLDKTLRSGFDNSCGFSRALKEINRVLKPGGKFIITAPNKT